MMNVKKAVVQLAAILPATILFSGIRFATDNFSIMAGEWQRTDGNYVIRVSHVQPAGQVTAEYFNPRPIHVAEAGISIHKGYIRLFIKFQDKGYEGSMYTLYYHAEEDSLVGLYYQATMNRSYKVYF